MNLLKPFKSSKYSPTNVLSYISPSFIYSPPSSIFIAPAIPASNLALLFLPSFLKTENAFLYSYLKNIDVIIQIKAVKNEGIIFNI